MLFKIYIYILQVGNESPQVAGSRRMRARRFQLSSKAPRLDSHTVCELNATSGSRQLPN